MFTLLMPGKQYKEAKICDCGYTTFESSNWSTHKKRCKLVVTADRELIFTLKEQLVAKDEQMKQQLAVKDEQMKEQLAVKDELLNEKREDLRIFEKLLAEKFSELQEEVKQLRKRKKARRISRSEPERRKIAQRQNWKCASETCELVGELQAYDLDHIIPLWKGGEDRDENLQALCPACHRKKTDLECLERVGVQT